MPLPLPLPPPPQVATLRQRRRVSIVGVPLNNTRCAAAALAFRVTCSTSACVCSAVGVGAGACIARSGCVEELRVFAATCAAAAPWLTRLAHHDATPGGNPSYHEEGTAVHTHNVIPAWGSTDVLGELERLPSRECRRALLLEQVR